MDQREESAQTCTALIKQHTIRRIPAGAENGRGSGAGIDIQSEGLFAHLIAGAGTTHPDRVQSTHPNILGLFTPGIMVLLKGVHNASQCALNQARSWWF